MEKIDSKKYVNGEFFKKRFINSDELIFLLKQREAKNIEFLLIDIREPYENRAISIEGTDILFPISKIPKNLDILEKFRDKKVVLYCRSGNRTEYLLSVAEQMEFNHMCHLKGGIIEYKGVTLRNQVPNIIY